MKRIFIFIIIICFFVGITGSLAKEELLRLVLDESEVLDSEEVYVPDKVIKVVNNLNFEVEEDRPIVKEGGLIKPMEFEQYVNYKFEKLEERIKKLEQKINNL